jgi:hypothetical protein
MLFSRILAVVLLSNGRSKIRAGGVGSMRGGVAATFDGIATAIKLAAPWLRPGAGDSNMFRSAACPEAASRGWGDDLKRGI